MQARKNLNPDERAALLISLLKNHRSYTNGAIRDASHSSKQGEK